MTNKMGTMPMNRLLLSMALPMMVSMLVQALYNVVDSIFVAMLSENALASVNPGVSRAKPDGGRGRGHRHGHQRPFVAPPRPDLPGASVDGYRLGPPPA